MTDDQILKDIVFPAVRAASRTLPGFPPPSEDDPKEQLSLYGAPGAILDSLNLVSFVFILEDEIKKVLGREFKITAEDVIGREINPFSSLLELARFIGAKLGPGRA